MYDSNQYKNKHCDNDVLKKYEGLIEKMIKDRVFSVGFDGKEFFVAEECDEYFSHFLTKEEAYGLSHMFREIAEYMEK